jgi:hypothetical protein
LFHFADAAGDLKKRGLRLGSGIGLNHPAFPVGEIGRRLLEYRFAGGHGCRNLAQPGQALLGQSHTGVPVRGG